MKDSIRYVRITHILLVFILLLGGRPDTVNLFY